VGWPWSLDNHWLDGVEGCAVAASIQGVELREMKFNRRKRRRVRAVDNTAASHAPPGTPQADYVQLNVKATALLGAG